MYPLPPLPKQEEDKTNKPFSCNIWEKNKSSAQLLAVSLYEYLVLGVGTVLRIGRDVWSIWSND